MARLLSLAVVLSFGGFATSGLASDDGATEVGSDTFAQLPEGAVARLGSIRLRHDAAVVGHVLLRGGSVLASVSNDRTVRAWDTRTGALLGRVDFAGDDGVPNAISRIDDSAFLVSLQGGKSIRMDADLKRLGEVPHPDVIVVTSAPGGALFAGTGEQQPDVILFDAEGNRVRAIDSGARRAVAWRFNRDGSRLAIAGWKLETRHTGTAHFLLADVATGETITSLDVGDSFVQSLAFSPDEKTVALGGGDGSLRLLDLENSVLGAPQKGHETSILTTEWSDDGRWIATGSARDGKVAVYDGEAGEWIHTFQAHRQSVADLSFSPDEDRLFTSSSDARLRVFLPDTGEALLELPGHISPVRCVDWSADGEWVATGGFDGTARLWSAETWAERQLFHCGVGSVNDVAFSPDGKQLAAVSQDAYLRVFSVETGERLYAVYDGNLAIFDVAWSPNGERLLTAHADGHFRLHDSISGRVLGRREVGVGFCFAVAFSPDGSKIAAASSQIKLWDAEELRELRPMGGPNAPVSRLVFDAEGRLWSGSADRRVIRWNVDTAEPEVEFVAHPSRVQSLALSPAGDVVATCGYGENALRLWSTSGEPVDVLPGHANIPTGVVFDPKGGRLASVGMDANGLIWKLR